ncbi:MAG: GDP-L-fucose synthase [Gammaproteobacteria bacterium]|nr:GDP-L-fucose synthase [Gammaproteobacteria bacterium]
MNPNSKIYVAGHRGLVGSALVRRLAASGYRNVITRTHAELDLTRQDAVQEFFGAHRPEYVFLAAAKVGGIYANSTYPADFIVDNLLITTNVVQAAHRQRVGKLLFLGSSCIYPKHAPQPMKEEYLLTGALEPTNEAYALAKIAGIKMCAAYNRQYGTDFLSVMPTNLYGLGDNYDLQNSHVLPALIRKMHEAKLRGEREVVVWGTGRPRREFLYCDDLADACVFLMERHRAMEIGEFINIGVGTDITIHELAGLVAQVVGFTGQLAFDTVKPDGTPQKLLDVSRIQRLGWRAKTELKDGIVLTYRDYLATLARAAQS